MNPQKQKSGMATASLVLGILAVLGLSVLAGIPAIICGHLAHKRARKSPEQFGGAGLAIGGFTLGYISFALTLVVAAILAFSLTSLDKAKDRALSVSCVNNLKQVGMAFKLWALDHDDRFTFNVPAQQGGTLESCARDSKGFDAHAAAHFQVMSNELYTPKILVCPVDSSKTAALDFSGLQAVNVSYWVRSGSNISDAFPSEVLVRCPVHGYTVTCDGSVKTDK